MPVIDVCVHGNAMGWCTLCIDAKYTIGVPVRRPDPDVLTVEEAADFLRIGRRQMYEALGRGEVPHQRIGRTIRLSRAALTKWLDARANPADTGRRSCGAASKGMK